MLLNLKSDQVFIYISGNLWVIDIKKNIKILITNFWLELHVQIWNNTVTDFLTWFRFFVIFLQSFFTSPRHRFRPGCEQNNLFVFMETSFPGGDGGISNPLGWPWFIDVVIMTHHCYRSKIVLGNLLSDVFSLSLNVIALWFQDTSFVLRKLTLMEFVNWNSGDLFKSWLSK